MFKAIFDTFFRLFNRFSPGLRDEYLRLRELIFSITTAQLEMVMDEPNTVYGVIMDSGETDLFVITIVAWANGEASLKTTVGGGVIGLGFDEYMMNEAKEIVKSAQSLVMNAKLVDSHEMPGSGRVRFYFLTTSGIRLSEFGLGEVLSTEHPFNGLFSRFGIFKNASDKIMDGWVPPSSKS
jgi:hypothetical protein